MFVRLLSRSFLSLRPFSVHGLRPVPLFVAPPVCQVRWFGGKKKGGKGGGHKDDKGEPEVENNFDLDEVKRQMSEAMEKYVERMGKLKLGRLDPRMLDDVRIPDKQARLRDLAQIVPRSNVEFFVKLFDPKNLDSVLSAIASSTLQLTARKDSLTSIVVNVPKANDEVRNEMLKEAKNMSEQTKNTIRKYRLTAIQDVKKIKSVGEDENKRMQKQIQTVSEQFCTKVDAALKEKEQMINSG